MAIPPNFSLFKPFSPKYRPVNTTDHDNQKPDASSSQEGTDQKTQQTVQKALCGFCGKPLKDCSGNKSCLK